MRNQTPHPPSRSTVAFLLVWPAAQVEAGRGLAVAATAFVQTMALVWAGSQVTKAPRAAGALLLAPAVDRLLELLRARLRLPTKRQAFLLAVLPACVGAALLLFASVVLCWA